MDDLLDNDGLGTNTTFTQYLKERGLFFGMLYHIIIFLVLVQVCWLVYIDQSYLAIILFMIALFNISITVHRYLVWRYEKLND